ncbi:MAG: lantibiotic dehydratase, partial [Chthoniobacterales bacterium]
MSDSSYRVAPIFLIRMAGVPFDVLEAIATPATAAAARTVMESVIHPEATEADSASAAAETVFNTEFEREMNAARSALLQRSREVLPPYLVFAGGGVHDLLTKLLAEGPDKWIQQSSRNARARDRERRLLLYLQRVCAKNDTFSLFGPSAWGKISDKSLAISSSAGAPIRRETFLERWTAQTVAAAMNADHEIRPELSPRLHPSGRVIGDRFIFTDTGEIRPLDSDTIALLSRCDGRTPAHSLGTSSDALENLAQQ